MVVRVLVVISGFLGVMLIKYFIVVIFVVIKLELIMCCLGRIVGWEDMCFVNFMNVIKDLVNVMLFVYIGLVKVVWILERVNLLIKMFRYLVIICRVERLDIWVMIELMFVRIVVKLMME